MRVVRILTSFTALGKKKECVDDFLENFWDCFETSPMDLARYLSSNLKETGEIF